MIKHNLFKTFMLSSWKSASNAMNKFQLPDQHSVLTLIFTGAKAKTNPFPFIYQMSVVCIWARLPISLSVSMMYYNFKQLI